MRTAKRPERPRSSRCEELHHRCISNRGIAELKSPRNVFSNLFSTRDSPAQSRYLPRMAQQTLTLGHSPDPDDAFMFYALAKGLIPTHGFRFEHILQDIQTLNERATR